MSDRAVERGLAVWIALRRVHEGGVAMLPGCWFDSGCPVPDYVATALDKLVSAGLVLLNEQEPEPGGVWRVTATDAGCAHYVALCQIHRPGARVTVRTPYRWAYSRGISAVICSLSATLIRSGS